MSGRKIDEATCRRAMIAYGETGCVREAARRAGINAATLSRWLADWHRADTVAVLVELGRRRTRLQAEVIEQRALERMAEQLQKPGLSAVELAKIAAAASDLAIRRS